jgi:O-antigen/teichoic acid export membrane protein
MLERHRIKIGISSKIIQALFGLIFLAMIPLWSTIEEQGVYYSLINLFLFYSVLSGGLDQIYLRRLSKSYSIETKTVSQEFKENLREYMSTLLVIIPIYSVFILVMSYMIFERVVFQKYGLEIFVIMLTNLLTIFFSSFLIIFQSSQRFSLYYIYKVLITFLSLLVLAIMVILEQGFASVVSFHLVIVLMTIMFVFPELKNIFKGLNLKKSLKKYIESNSKLHATLFLSSISVYMLIGLLTPLSGKIFSIEIAGKIGLVIMILSHMMSIANTVTYDEIPNISRNIHNKEEAAERYKRKAFKATLFYLIGCGIIYGIIEISSYLNLFNLYLERLPSTQITLLIMAIFILHFIFSLIIQFVRCFLVDPFAKNYFFLIFALLLIWSFSIKYNLEYTLMLIIVCQLITVLNMVVKTRQFINFPASSSN